MAVIVMINNYLHDLATAVFAVSALATYFLLRTTTFKKIPDALSPVVKGLIRVGIVALVWTLAGGVVRALAYRRYEWMEAVGRDQVPALIVKHVLLVSVVIAGLVVFYHVRRLVRVGDAGEVHG